MEQHSGASVPIRIAAGASQRLLIRSASGNHQMDYQTLQFVPCAQSITSAKLGSLNEDSLLIIVAAFKQSPATMHRIESTSRSLAKAVSTMATCDQLVWVPRHFTAPQDAVDYAAASWGGGTVVLSTGKYEGKLLLAPGVHVVGQCKVEADMSSSDMFGNTFDQFVELFGALENQMPNRTGIKPRSFQMMSASPKGVRWSVAQMIDQPAV